MQIDFGYHLESYTSIRNLVVVMPYANMDATHNVLVKC